MKIARLVISFLLSSLAVTASAAELSVLAASSLCDSLQEIAQAYQKKYPDDSVLFNFAGSQTLATQIEQGVPADLFISANRSVMERLEQQRLASAPQQLVGNRLILAAQPELAASLQSISDLARPGLLLAVGNPQVPVGHYTRQLFQRLAEDPAYGRELVEKISRNIVSEESKVKAIIAKLQLGEVDAGLVYQSDLTAPGCEKLLAIPLPEGLSPLAHYPVALVTGGQPAGQRFLDFLLSPAAQKIFARHGFLTGANR